MNFTIFSFWAIFTIMFGVGAVAFYAMVDKGSPGEVFPKIVQGWDRRGLYLLALFKAGLLYSLVTLGYDQVEIYKVDSDKSYFFFTLLCWFMGSFMLNYLTWMLTGIMLAYPMARELNRGQRQLLTAS